MKTLQEYILEAMTKKDLIDFLNVHFTNEKNKIDYDNVIKVLKDNGKTDVHKRFKDFCDNKNISPKSWIEFYEFEFELISFFVNKLITGDLQLNIKEIFNETQQQQNIFNLIIEKINDLNNTKIEKNDLRQLLINISKFKVDVGKTDKGRFEYLCYLLIKGKRDEKASQGDVVFDNTQIEVKYCNNANFKPYNSGSLSKSAIANIKNCNADYNIVNFLLDCLINKDINNNINSNHKELIKKFVLTYFKKNDETNIYDDIHEDIKNLNEQDIKNFIGTCQFYLYLHNEFIKENKYLILFDGVKENSENYGNYIFYNANIDSLEEVIKFCKEHIKWGAIHRNAIQFMLKK